MDLLYRVNKTWFFFGKVHSIQIVAQKSHSLIMSAYIPSGTTLPKQLFVSSTTGNRRQSLLVINYTGQLWRDSCSTKKTSIYLDYFFQHFNFSSSLNSVVYSWNKRKYWLECTKLRHYFPFFDIGIVFLRHI